MDELKILNWQGLFVDDSGRTFTLGEPIELDYAEEYYEFYDCPEINKLTINEPVTMAGEIAFFNSYELEKIIGPSWFCDFAIRWAYFNHKDLLCRMRNTKRKRIRKKYCSRIIKAYRNYLEGK